MILYKYIIIILKISGCGHLNFKMNYYNIMIL